MYTKRQAIIDQLKGEFQHLNIFSDKYSPHIVCIDEKTQQEVLLVFHHDFSFETAKQLLASSKIAKPMVKSS
jgi:hypothetical protein